MLDFSAKPEPAEEWSQENTHSKLPGLCLASSSSSKGGYGVIASCSTKTDLRVFSTSGRQARLLRARAAGRPGGKKGRLAASTGGQAAGVCACAGIWLCRCFQMSKRGQKLLLLPAGCLGRWTLGG